MIPEIVSSPDYRAEAAQQRRAPRRSRWPDVVVALLLIGIVAAMITFWPRVAGPLPEKVRPVTFEVHLAETAPGTGLIPATVVTSGEPVFLHAEPVIENSHVEHAIAVGDGVRIAIEVTLNEQGARQLREATKNHTGKRLAVLIDGQVRMAPIIHTEISEHLVIDSNFTVTEAKVIARGLIGNL